MCGQVCVSGGGADAQMAPEVPEVGGKVEGSNVSLALGTPEWVEGRVGAVAGSLAPWSRGRMAWTSGCVSWAKDLVDTVQAVMGEAQFGPLGWRARPRLPPGSGGLAVALEGSPDLWQSCFLQLCL